MKGRDYKFLELMDKYKEDKKFIIQIKPTTDQYKAGKIYYGTETKAEKKFFYIDISEYIDLDNDNINFDLGPYNVQDADVPLSVKKIEMEKAQNEEEEKTLRNLYDKYEEILLIVNNDIREKEEEQAKLLSEYLAREKNKFDLSDSESVSDSDSASVSDIEESNDINNVLNNSEPIPPVPNNNNLRQTIVNETKDVPTNPEPTPQVTVSNSSKHTQETDNNASKKVKQNSNSKDEKNSKFNLKNFSYAFKTGAIVGGIVFVGFATPFLAPYAANAAAFMASTPVLASLVTATRLLAGTIAGIVGINNAAVTAVATGINAGVAEKTAEVIYNLSISANDWRKKVSNEKSKAETRQK